MALRELSEKLVAHVASKHQQDYIASQGDLQKLILMVGWYFMMHKYAKLPTDETWLIDLMGKHRQVISEILGLNQAPEKTPSGDGTGQAGNNDRTQDDANKAQT